MFGNNPARPPSTNNGDNLQVKHIFPTLQGEGPFVGYPSVFIRLGGCNLTCNFCDTEFENFEVTSLEKIVEQVRNIGKNTFTENSEKLVVITGGEPLRQSIEKLCEQLIIDGYLVQIETNGTMFRKINSNVKIVCSPKNLGKGYKRIRENLLPKITALKFLISASNKDYSDIAEVGQADYNIPVYLQPMDEYDLKKNAENLELAKKLTFKYKHRLSLQMHKLIGVK
jgi:7-carboxy-7-deazaguanine synthase